MHVVTVAVGVKGMGVRVVVGVSVEGNGLFVGVIVTVDVARAVIFTHGVFDV
jgi:phosphohistidine swiveling domain-containing protein